MKSDFWTIFMLKNDSLWSKTCIKQFEFLNFKFPHHYCGVFIFFSIFTRFAVRLKIQCCDFFTCTNIWNLYNFWISDERSTKWLQYIPYFMMLEYFFLVRTIKTLKKYALSRRKTYLVLEIILNYFYWYILRIARLYSTN